MIRVDYAGPGGACEGLRTLGLHPVGIEWDAAACATRAAAGHLTIRADLATYRPHHRPGTVDGYWSSPPCQTFSTAGKGDGRDQLDDLAAVIHAERWTDADLFDPRTRHVIDAARTAVELAPGWVAMEQVPAVLPLWRALAHVLERHGYSTWCGVLCAADYGVPQTRRRAILMASRVSAVSPPAPTHAERPGMFGERPWVSMADALGWSDSLALREVRGAGIVERHGDRSPRPATMPAPTLTGHFTRTEIVVRSGSTVAGGPLAERSADEPAPTLTGIAGSKGQWLVKRERSGDRSEETFDASGPAQALTSKARSWEVKPPWPFHQPATTVAGDPRITARCHHEAGSQGANAVDIADVAAGVDGGDRPIRLTVRDALILQGFDPAYPVQGSRTKQFEQVGNAIPPPLAAHIVAALTGAHYERNVA